MLLRAAIFQNYCHIPLTDSYYFISFDTKLQLSDNILQNQVVQLRLGDEDSGAATVHC